MSRFLNDQIITTTEGHYSSCLLVKDRLLYYTITLNLVAGTGTFEFILGPATQENLNEMSSYVESLENELMCFTQLVKDNYIDNMGKIERLLKYRTSRIKVNHILNEKEQ